MIKILLMILLAGCSSIKELSVRERVKGNYLFNLKLKAEYTRFMAESGLTTKNLFAGPAMIHFLNGQSIQLIEVSARGSSIAVYRSPTNSEIEYLGHHLIATGKDIYRLEFDAVFKGLTQKVTQPLGLELKVACKKSVKCQMDPDYDFALHSSPYNFTFEYPSSVSDYFTHVEPKYENQSPREQTAVMNRMIFVGMSEAAALQAIGKYTQHMHGFYNVRFREGLVYDYEFKFDHNLHYFNR